MAQNRDLYEVVAEILIELREMKGELREMKGELREVKGELQTLNQRVEKVEDAVVRNNPGLGELRLSVIRLDETLKASADYDERLRRLEQAVFRQGA